MKYYVTEIVSEAVASGCYIGEVDIYPRDLANDVRLALTGNPLPQWSFCYYGEPDRRLCKMFGYDYVELKYRKALDDEFIRVMSEPDKNKLTRIASKRRKGHRQYNGMG